MTRWACQCGKVGCFRSSIGCFLFICLFGFSTLVTATPKNILIILSDDQGYSELGPFLEFAPIEALQLHRQDILEAMLSSEEGRAAINSIYAAVAKSTPNLDQLAADGVRFTNFYAAPNCAPSRAALMTGIYPQKFGVYGNDDAKDHIPASVDFMVKAFQDANYMTGMIGKWHLGDARGQHPNDRGFDYFFGYDRAHTHKYDSNHLFENRSKVKAEGWLNDQLTEKALDFLARANEAGKPFFLYFASPEPKPPVAFPPEKYMRAIDSGYSILDAHFGSIYGMDYGIGLLLAKIHEMGASEDTMIVFASDNGLNANTFLRSPDFRGDSQGQRVPIPGNGLLRGCKWTTWDGGVRVPMIAYIPEARPGDNDNLHSILDVIPTALDYAGLLEDYADDLDGVSFLSALTDETISNSTRALYWASLDAIPDGGDGLEEFTPIVESFRALTGRRNFVSSWYVRQGSWKLIAWDGRDPFLFDIDRDPAESTNLADNYPEVVSRLQAAFNGWMHGNIPPLQSPKEVWLQFR